MRSRTITAMATLAMAVSVIGAYAQTSTNATPTGSHVLQGGFEAGGSPTFGLNNGNSKRVGYGGGTGTTRCNQPIYELALPEIPAGESLSAATLTVDVTSISGNPLFFEVLASLMTAADVSEFEAAPDQYFVAETAPLDSTLANGIVFAQFAQSDVPVGGTLEIPVRGAALAQLNSLYNPAGLPNQSTVWFRLSTSVTNDPSAWQGGDRIQFADHATEGTWAAFGLELNWASVPVFIADPIVKANVTWGSDYAALSQSLAGSATNSAGDTVFYEKTGGPDWLVIATNGALSGIADVTGTNEFSIKAIAAGESTIGNLQIVVDTVGNPPVFTTDINERVDGTFGEDYATLSQTLAGSATDPDGGDILTYSRAGGGPGWLTVDPDGTLSGVCDVLGTNTFPIQVTDGNGNYDAASLVIVVQTVGSSPEFTVDPIVTADGQLNEDYALEAQTLEDSATDLDGDTLTYSKNGGPSWLIVATNGALSGVAGTGTVGTNSFTVKVDDGNGNSDTAELLIYVAPLPVGDLILGLDTFDSIAAPTADFTAAGLSVTITASASNNAAAVNWANTDSGTDPGRGSSDDGTWGSHAGPPAASTNTTTGPANFTLTNGKTYGELTFTLSNIGTEAIELGQFHFDASAFRPNASRTIALNVLAGSDITVGNVYSSPTQVITVTGLGHDLHDAYDLDLTGLDDHTLEVGGVAIIQLVFSGGTGAGGGHHLFVDNIGISTAAALGAPESPVLTITPSGSDVIVSWTSDREFRLQSKPQLGFGDWVDVLGGDSSPVTVPAEKAAEFFSLLWEE